MEGGINGVVVREGCTLSGFSDLFAPIPLDRVGPPHRDVHAGHSSWGVVVVAAATVRKKGIRFQLASRVNNEMCLRRKAEREKWRWIESMCLEKHLGESQKYRQSQRERYNQI